MALSKEEKAKRTEKRRLEKYNKVHRVNEDGIDEKICSDCQQWFPATEEYFYKNKCDTVDGLNPYCKECTKKRSKKWGEDNLERKRFLANRYIPDKDRQRELSQNRRDSGKHRKWQQDNPEKIKKYWEKRKNKNHKLSSSEWQSCKNYFNNCCAYCGLPVEEHYIKYKGELKSRDLHKEHVDHDGAIDLSNCIPSCQKCNSSKGTHSMEFWYEVQDFFTEERLNKIYKWLNNDYKLYIEEHKPRNKYNKKDTEYWENRRQ